VSADERKYTENALKQGLGGFDDENSSGGRMKEKRNIKGDMLEDDY
jgi:hypothetical protein